MNRTGWERLIQAQVARLLGIAPSSVDPARPFADLGMSSAQCVELAHRLAEETGRALQAETLWAYPTVLRLAAALAPGSPDDDHAPVLGSSVAQAHDPIAIVGIGCRLPGADGPVAFWQALAAGRDLLADADAARLNAGGDDPGRAVAAGGFVVGLLPDVRMFDREAFGITPDEAAWMDPQHRLLLEVTAEALDDAGVGEESLTAATTGVFVGIASHDYADLCAGQMGTGSGYAASGNAASTAANRLSYAFNLTGPSMSVDSACSSSLLAVHLARQSMVAGECDQAIVGGVNVILSAALTDELGGAGLLSGQGRCRFGDATADGYVRSEGVAVVVLKRLRAAVHDRDRVYAVLLGSASGHGGMGNGLTAAHPGGQEQVLRRACHDAGVTPTDVTYIEAQGTGSSLGDAIELSAVHAVYATRRRADNPVLVGSVKSNVGHTEAAAGVVGLVKAALAVHHGLLVPTLHISQPTALLSGSAPIAAVDRPTRWPDDRRLAGVSAFGIGGTNVHVIIGAPEPESAAGEQTPAGPHLLVVSASSAQGLTTMLAQYERSLPADLPAACAAAARRRHHGRYRAAMVAWDAASMRTELRARRDRTSTAAGTRPKVAFVYPGHAEPHPGLGDLWSGSATFRAAVADVDRALVSIGAASPLAAFEAGGQVPTRRMDGLALFAAQIGLTRVFEDWGVTPDIFAGLGAGEAAASWARGTSSLDEAACDIAGGDIQDAELDCAAIERLREATAGADVIVEISPHPVLVAALAERGPVQPGRTLLASMTMGQAAAATLLRALGVIYEAGGRPRWRRVFTGRVPHSPLPPQVWRRELLWMPKPARANGTGPVSVSGADRRAAAMTVLYGSLGLTPADEGWNVPLRLAGADSLAVTRLRGRLQAEFGLAVPMEELLGGLSAAMVADLVASPQDKPAGSVGVTWVGASDDDVRTMIEILEAAEDGGER